MESGCELLNMAIASHGGMERWCRIGDIRAKATTGGIALPSRFQPSVLKHIDAVVSTGAPRTEFHDFGGKGRTGIFEDGGIRIIGPDGRVLSERGNAWQALGGIRRKIFWDRLDALYFGGYALWNYLNLPFLLAGPGMVLKEIGPWINSGEEWMRLHALFPGHFPTHCRKQIFYFNQRGLLVRHDYTAEIFGRCARACHYSSEHREIDGIVFPTMRRVHPRLPSNHPVREVMLVSIRIDELEMREKERTRDA